MNIDQTSYQDTMFIGEDASYDVTIYMFNLSFTSNPVRCSIKPASFVSSTLIENERTRLIWNKCQFTHAFRKYILSGLPKPAAITSIQDTTYIDVLPPFGPAGGKYYLQVVGKDSTNAKNFDTISGPQLGKQLVRSDLQILKYVPGGNFFMGWSSLGSFTIGRYGGDSLNPIMEKQMDFIAYGDAKDVVDDGSYMYICIDGSTGGLVRKINCLTLESEETYDFSSLIQHPYWHIFDLKVTRDNILAAIFTDDNSYMHLYVFDMDAKTVLANLPLGYGAYLAKLQITKDAKYIMFGVDLFSFQGNTITKIGSSERGFFSQDDSTLIRASSQSIQFLRCSDLQVFKELPVNETLDPFFQYFDYSSGLLAVSSDNGYTIYDVNNPLKKASIRCTTAIISFQNDILFASYGFFKRVILN